MPIDSTAYGQADILLKLPRRSGPPLAPGKTSAPAEKHHDGGGRAAPVNGEKDARESLAPEANSHVMMRNQESSERGPTGRAAFGLAEASLRNAAARPKVSPIV